MQALKCKMCKVDVDDRDPGGVNGVRLLYCEKCEKLRSSDEWADRVAKMLTGSLALLKENEPLLVELFEAPVQQRIRRIKIVRDHTGLDLKRAKSVVDQVGDSIPSFKHHLQDELTNARATIATQIDEGRRLRNELDHVEAKLRVAVAVRASVEDSLDDKERECEEISRPLRLAEPILGALSMWLGDDKVARGLVEAVTGLVEQALGHDTI